ncbi:hypothetical protein ACIQF6_29875 [Kitasatospora sp. NPDC092948]|uniref:hypothetical protein n=1 Tax=Kitasatospora sp. NPDC092948 TaxID=3364088 RepID=UPI00380BFE5B
MSTDITPNGPDEPTGSAAPAGSADPWAAPGASAGDAAPGDPSADPWSVPGEADDAASVEERKRDHKRFWQIGTAVMVTLLLGSATAVAVTLPDRTDVPGLATPNDGRYAFPELTLPPLPAGASAPSDYKIKTHAADLRGLLLPMPKGAVGTGPSAAPSASPSASASASASPDASGAASPSATASLPPVVGRWVPCDQDMMLAKDDKYARYLVIDACRGAAAESWTAKDGTHAELRLIRFGSQDEASHFCSNVNLMPATKDIEATRVDISAKAYTVRSGQVNARISDAKAGDVPTGRVGWIQYGDVVGLIQLTNPNGVPDQAFRQMLMLQSAMLD